MRRDKQYWLGEWSVGMWLKMWALVGALFLIGGLYIWLVMPAAPQ